MALKVDGHPNCEWGECENCHDVSCLIYLGYEEPKPYDDTELTESTQRP
jgi:hypothetical protein